MSTHYNRRNWLKATSLMASGVAVSPALQTLSARPIHRQGVKEYFYQELDASVALKAKLNANENPYGPSPMAKLAIMEAATQGNRYGHREAYQLIEMIAEKEGVTKDHIMLGPGSTDMLEKVAITSFLKGGNVLSAAPAYMSLVNTSMAIGADWKNVHLTPDHAHDLPGMKAAIDSQTKLVYVCNPNNPTGSLTPSDDLKAFCSEVSDKVPVFVDEAYLEFLSNPMSKSMVGLVAEGKDVIVARTFSKVHGMAGLRIGYIVAKPERIENLKKMVRGTMGLCVTSIYGAMASLKDTKFQEMTVTKTEEAREFTYEKLSSMGFEPIPSHTSFMIFPINMPGKQALDKMADKGVGIRVFTIDDSDWLRVSMGTMPEMELFVSALGQVLG